MSGGKTLVASGVLAFGLLALSPATALASDAEDRVTSFDAEYVIGADGVVTVTETIGYDFGQSPNHGIYRDIPDREPAGDGKDRIWGIENVEVISPTGAPDYLELQDNGGILRLRIGHPQLEVTGPQTYEISYTIRAGLNAFNDDAGDRAELYWDATGTAWDVPIDAATVTVRAPGGIDRVTCYRGPVGAKETCAQATTESPKVATFSQSGLAAREGLTVVVGLAGGAVTVPPVRLVGERNRSGTAIEEFTSGVGPAQLGIAGAILVVALGIAGLAYRLGGRDRRAYKTPIGMGPAIAPEFSPPEDIPPALAGTLVDEKADNLDLAATIVDLAVRGHLRIEELPAAGYQGERDWRLTRLDPPAGAPVTPFEQRLLDVLFGVGPQTQLTGLRYQHAGARFEQLKEDLYQASVELGWFRRHPAAVRTSWRLTGRALLILGGVGAVAAFFFAQYGLLVLGLAVTGAGAVVWRAAGAMPSRTIAGSALHERVLGFKRYLAVAEGEQLRFEVNEEIFSRYLPYAMVFGVVDQWARAFSAFAANSGVRLDGPAW